MYMFRELSFYAEVATFFKISLSEYSCNGTQSVGISLLYKLVTLTLKKTETHCLLFIISLTVIILKEKRRKERIFSCLN
ncbi:hypothetical protein VNO80_29559 [Phaseolus coccineus]|uniref:Uncharacterized protein n=1 Tax=Phaseolus coccineus TaxID=3886 RepID=A0AAN9LBJ8_PHACN